MNITLLVLVAALGIDPQFEAQNAPQFYNSPPILQTALAQGRVPSTYEEDPNLGKTVDAQPGAIYTPQGGYPTDPFLGGGLAPGGGYAVDPGYSFGPVGPQPYRFGWTSRTDVGFTPKSSTDGASGSLSILETNTALRYTTGWPPSMPNWIFSWTPEFNTRYWSGPSSPALPGYGMRIASDFEFSTPGNNPWSMQLGFTPAFVNDLDASVNSDSFNWDGRAVLFFRPNPVFMIALGAAYLDRVTDMIIPYAGIVWTPNQNWEWRLMFPKTRVSVFLGNWWGEMKWAYVGVEYNIEAYQIGIPSPSGQDEKVQFVDYRATLGLRGEAGGVSTFGEIGWVFAREVDYLHGTPGYDVSPNLYVRAGIRF